MLMGGCATIATEQGATPAPTPTVRNVAPGALAAAEEALRQENYEVAVSRFRRVLQQDPAHAGEKLGLAEAHLGLGAPSEALKAFTELTGAPEVRPAALQGKGIALLLMGQAQQAHEALREAVSEDRSLWRAWNALGRYYDFQRDWAKAQTAYEQAITAAPSPAVIYNNRGMSALSQSRYEEAVSHFTEALRLDSNLEIAESNLRLALAFQGNYAEAISGIGHDELPMALNNIGYIALLRGDYTRAEAYFLRAIETSPSFNPKNLGLLNNMKVIGAADEKGER
jgi:Flp pilus assembly protein TadD